MKKVAVLTGVLFISCLGRAQNDMDALRYSRLDFGGTSRYNSLAGAFGALGGDFSVCSTNPAGIAVYRKSELSFSPSLYHSGTRSNYMTTTSNDEKYNFNFGNFGFVLSGHNDDNNDWKGFSLGIGYNRLANFHNRILVQGINSRSSILDLWLSDANSHQADTNAFDDFSTNLAWKTGLIRRATPTSYYHIIPNHGEMQTKSVETRGALGETVFTLGANYGDKIYIGGTFGFPRIRYTEESAYTESVFNDTVYKLTSFKYSGNLQTTGAGFNFKFGILVRPADFIRIGAAIHTPTYFRMNDQYSNAISTVYTYKTYNWSSKNGSFDYTLTTPMRAIGSIALLYKDKGLISFDYELVDYGSARLRSPSYPFINENAAVQNKYKTAGNMHIGAEVKLSPFSLRGGYALYGSPFKNNINNGQKQSFTFGTGYRGANFYIDAAYVYTMYQENYYLYDPTLTDPASNSINAYTIMFTVGFRY